MTNVQSEKIFWNNLSKELQQICGIHASYQAVINSRAQSIEQAQHKNHKLLWAPVFCFGCDFHSSKCTEGHWARILKYTSSPILFDDAEPGDTLQGMLGGSEVNISWSRTEDHLLGWKHSACIWWQERTTSLIRIGIQYHILCLHTVQIAGRSLLQNLTGDCWLLAAIAGVAEFPSYFKDHVFVTQASQTVRFACIAPVKKYASSTFCRTFSRMGSTNSNSLISSCRTQRAQPLRLLDLLLEKKGIIKHQLTKDLGGMEGDRDWRLHSIYEVVLVGYPDHVCKYGWRQGARAAHWESLRQNAPLLEHNTPQYMDRNYIDYVILYTWNIDKVRHEFDMRTSWYKSLPLTSWEAVLSCSFHLCWERGEVRILY